MRKRLTEMFPFLIPFRKWERNIIYFLKMHFDGNKYAKIKEDELLPYCVCECQSLLINEDSGYDLKYQINKVHNLKITSMTMNRLLIFPGEVFSFCKLAKNYKKYGEYKDGLVLVNKKIVPEKGGGICGLSNLLYYAFLQTPLTIKERHGHRVKSLPSLKGVLEGVDATVSSGWLDLKVKNDTNNIYQINISFAEKYLTIQILTNKEVKEKINIINENLKYYKKNNQIYERVDVVKEVINKDNSKKIRREKLYTEEVEVTYELSKDIVVEEER